MNAPFRPAKTRAEAKKLQRLTGTFSSLSPLSIWAFRLSWELQQDFNREDQSEMMSYEEALKIAGRYLKETRPVSAVDVQIVEKETITNEIGWVFFYQSTDFLRTGDIADMLAGNAPILVSKSTGDCVFLGTARPVDQYIDEYRKFGRICGP